MRRQELSSLDKFPRPDRGLGGVRIEDSLNSTGGPAYVGRLKLSNCVTKATPCWCKIGVGPIHQCKLEPDGSFVWRISLVTQDLLILE